MGISASLKLFIVAIPKRGPSIPRLDRERVLRALLLGAIPWLPAVLFEGATFWSGVAGRGDLYGLFTGTRMVVDICSFALGGVLASRLLKTHLALFHALLSTFVFWVFLYDACFTFVSPNGLLHSGCYQTGPDGLAGYRLALFMFSLEALPILLTLGESPFSVTSPVRPVMSILAGVVVATAASWYVVSAWFSGVLFYPVFEPFQILTILGIPGLATGMIVARISRDLKTPVLAGAISIVFLSLSFLGLTCPMCDRSGVLLAIPTWMIFALVGGFLERGESYEKFSTVRSISRGFPCMRYLAVALVMTVALSPAIFQPYWDPSVMYTPQSNAQLVYGIPAYRPYVAGYFDSSQYRICCLEVGVNFSSVDTARIGSGNYLMAGMGVQSPNCCVHGWDLGWRADVYVLANGTVLVSADTWGTCDGNANCGGHFWQNPRYRTETVLHSLPSISSPIFLRMMWESGRVNWYYNYTGVPWQKYGSFTPDYREGRNFDIGVVLGGRGNPPYQKAFFYQFGVSSNKPIAGWTVRLLYPSFMYQSAWTRMDQARTIQGDHSYWKANYRWGGYPYEGVAVKANALNPAIAKNVVEFSALGGRRGFAYNPCLWVG